jgi:hypothetical protein
LGGQTSGPLDKCFSKKEEKEEKEEKDNKTKNISKKFGRPDLWTSGQMFFEKRRKRRKR